jgi:hypothetical protein
VSETEEATILRMARGMIAPVDLDGLSEQARGWWVDLARRAYDAEHSGGLTP